jgi:anti-sigma B factor antagonist
LSVAYVRKDVPRELMMTRSLTEHHTFRDGIYSIQLEGKVNMMTVPRIRKALLISTKRNDVVEVCVDLSRVTELDTAGVAMLVEVWRGLAGRAAALRLAGLSRQARRLIQLARLDHVFEVVDDNSKGSA